MERQITRNSFGVVLAMLLALSWPNHHASAQEGEATPAAASEATTVAPEPEVGSNVTTATGGENRATLRASADQDWVRRDALVVIGDSAELGTNEVTEAMVVIGGNSLVRGKVDAAAVVIGGNMEIEGEVRDAVVAVMGSVTLKPGAVVRGDVVAVGGKVVKSEGALVEGHVQEVGLALPNLRWLQEWFLQCVLKMRPLAPQVGWVWGVAGIVFLFYLLIAALFTRPIATCVEEINRRPATTFLLGLLTKLLLPILFLILAATGLGLFVIPFIIAALIIGLVVGKVALLEWIGFRIRPSWNPLLALTVGSLIVCILYIIPFLGIIVWGVLSVWGIGVAVAATFGGLRRELPERSPGPVAPAVPLAASIPAQPIGTPPADGPSTAYAVPPGPSATPAAGAPPISANPATGTGTPAFTMPVGGAPGTGAMPPVVPEALSYPRARFWERLGAGLIDIILLSTLANLVDVPPLGFLLALAYFVGMWMWRGTTIGGVVLNLRVVRLDGQKITFPVSLVRALTGAFGIVFLFLGMFWLIWDPEKQSWQDKVAGTVVVKTPRGVPLLML